MTRDILYVAKKLICRRRFDKAIILLEGRNDIYKGIFEYYLLLGIACLYAGDSGGASAYFQRARTIKLLDTNLLLGQAAIFLRRGDTDRAIEYYLEILEYDPSNKVALRAMEFIRLQGDYTTICKWVDTGKIEKFYPPIGINTYKIASILIPFFCFIFGIFFIMNISSRLKKNKEMIRADLSPLALTEFELKKVQDIGLSSDNHKYNLSSAQITQAYKNAQKYFQQYRDNSAQIEINRILNSNASHAVKQKTKLLMDFIEPPSFDSIKDVPSYKEVEKDPFLYSDCWVSWKGRVTNMVQTDSIYSCDLLIGYENMEKVEGIIPVKFAVPPSISQDKPVLILGKISLYNGKLYLEGRAAYQSIKGSLPSP